jgi:hypothetical protein
MKRNARSHEEIGASGCRNDSTTTKDRCQGYETRRGERRRRDGRGGGTRREIDNAEGTDDDRGPTKRRRRSAGGTTTTPLMRTGRDDRVLAVINEKTEKNAEWDGRTD